jgi:hypothetical protein
MEVPKSRRFARVGLQAIFLLVFAGLIYSNYSLRHELAQLKAIARDNRARLVMKAGEPFPAFQARDLAGNRLTLTKDLGREVRLLVVDPECPRCETVIEQLRRTKPADVIVVSLRPRPLSNKIVNAVGNAAPLYFVDRTAPQVLQGHLDVVPRVITVGANGTIRQLCHDLETCQPTVEACEKCTPAAGS